MQLFPFLILVVTVLSTLTFAQGLQILSATYGEGRNTRDVTAAVAARVQSTGLRIQADPSTLGGDPAPGVVKVLRVRYSIDGAVTEVIARDGDWVTVSAGTRQAPGGIRSRQNREAQLRILSAQYGVGNRQADVTAALSGLIQNDALNVAVNNASMGVDPAPANKKTLRVSYQWQGQTMETAVAEDTVLTLPVQSQTPIVTRDQVNIFDRLTGRNPLNRLSAQ